jgi:hypothetical protein
VQDDLSARILVAAIERELREDLGEAHVERAVDDDAERALIVCSQISVTVRLKFGSLSAGIAIRSWLVRYAA